MDSWNQKQLAKMKVGGNSQCTRFFNEYGVDIQSTGIKSAYDGPVAELYRNKISALAEGQPWTPPADKEKVKRQEAARRSSAPTKSVRKAAAKESNGFDDDDFDSWDWGDKQTNQQTRSTDGLPGGSSYQNNATADQRIPIAQRSLSNAPPTQPTEQPDYLKSLSEGWGKFTIAATKAANATAEQAKIAADKLQKQSKEVSEKPWAQEAQASVSKGFSLLSSYVQKAKESLLDEQPSTSQPVDETSASATRTYDGSNAGFDSPRPTQSPKPPISANTNQNFEDWLNDEEDDKYNKKPKRKPKAAAPAPATPSQDEFNIYSQPPATKAAPAKKSAASKVDEWDDWGSDEEVKDGWMDKSESKGTEKKDSEWGDWDEEDKQAKNENVDDAWDKW